MGEVAVGTVRVHRAPGTSVLGRILAFFLHGSLVALALCLIPVMWGFLGFLHAYSSVGRLEPIGVDERFPETG